MCTGCMHCCAKSAARNRRITRTQPYTYGSGRTRARDCVVVFPPKRACAPASKAAPAKASGERPSAPPPSGGGGGAGDGGGGGAVGTPVEDELAAARERAKRKEAAAADAKAAALSKAADTKAAADAKAAAAATAEARAKSQVKEAAPRTPVRRGLERVNAEDSSSDAGASGDGGGGGGGDDCPEFVLDMNGEFGSCKNCGKKQADHSDAARSGRGGGRRARSRS